MSAADPAPPSFDRGPAPEVAPVERDGLRYVQHAATFDPALGQMGGLLDIVDIASGKTVATIKVYDNQREPGLEGDVQDIFFASMAFDDAGHLIVTDEVGRRFAVDVKARSAAPLP